MQTPVPAIGSLVWIRRQRWRVEYARRERTVVRLDVASDAHRMTFLTPFDRAEPMARSARPVRARRQQISARLAGLRADSRSLFGLPAARDAAIDLLPYQLEPALAVLDATRRILIADEIGMGKTIQAGLAIAALAQHRPDLRALVVTPAALCEQWRIELETRFRLPAVLADRRALERRAMNLSSLESPWSHGGISIASLDYLKQPHVLDALPFVPWDIVVIDEAHDACGESQRYEACQEIARRSRHVLLLTATPHSGDAARFARLQSLGSLGLTTDGLVTFRRTRQEQRSLRRRNVRWHRTTLDPSEVRLLDGLTAFERAVLRQRTTASRSGAILLLAVFRKRALSSVAAQSQSLSRRLAWLEMSGRAHRLDWLQQRLTFDDVHDDLTEGEKDALIADTGLPPAQERAWLRRLMTLAGNGGRSGKFDHIHRLLRRSSEPAVIFTEFRDSLEALQRRLEAIRVVAVMHGGQTAAVRQAALQTFLRGAASVLLATDVAAQGLNLQTRARWMISLELPWNPLRLEQRIGRIDRIGQPRAVHVSLLTARHAAEDGLLTRMSRRALIAQRALGDSTFRDVTPPSMLTVATALFSGATRPPDPELRAEPVALSTQWTRRGQSVTRMVGRARQLMAQWRTASWLDARPRWTGSPHSDHAAVFAVPIVGASGLALERILVTVPLGCSLATARSDDRVLARARRSALTRLQSRLRRLRRAALATATRRAEAERGIATHLLALEFPDRTNPTLFSRRLPNDDDELAAEAQAAATARVQQQMNEGALELGMPSIELFVALGR